ncbi:MAG: hypothetical protein NC122_08620 [Faecalibacterium sp.]|nr:hypothetical protein [Ruminococcus sp.]MCM1392541.1 hypothetical protein [Ruminococcus sp.]MCM1486257.1 hypothetical protein [Faecalibacterium sp.]
MLEQVENKIQQLGEQQKEEYYKRKDEDLIAWGLSGKKGKKSAPIIVTDEEYEALIEASNGVGKSSRNNVGKMMSVASGVIITLGIIIGAVVFSFADDLGFVYFSISLFSAILLALLFRGVGEAIRLLQQLLDIKQGEKFREARSNKDKAFPVQPSVSQQFANSPEVNFTNPNANGDPSDSTGLMF